MNKNFILLLNEYCSDHRKHFGCYPLEFEYDGKVYAWNDFICFIQEKNQGGKYER